MNNALTMRVEAPTQAKRPKEDTENRGECCCISIDFTENGFATRASFDPEKIDPKKDRYSQMPEDEKFTFGSGAVPTKTEADNVLSYIKELLYAHVGEEVAEGDGKGKKKMPTGGKAMNDDGEEEAEA